MTTPLHHTHSDDAGDLAGALAGDPDSRLAKDLATFRVAGRRRLWSTVLVAVTLVGVVQLGQPTVPIPVMMGLFLLVVLCNTAVAYVTQQRRLHRPWLRVPVAVYDTLLISLVVAIIGAPALSVLYLLVLLPYTFAYGRTFGFALLLASEIGFLGASAAHVLLAPGAPGDGFASGGFASGGFASGGFASGGFASGAISLLSGGTALSALLLAVVAAQLIPIPAAMTTRMRRTRRYLDAVRSGTDAVRAESYHHDDLGDLDRSCDATLAAMTQLLADVQQEGAAVAAVAEQVGSATNTLHERTHDVQQDVTALLEGVQAQRDSVSAGASASREAREAAVRAVARAEETARDAERVNDTTLASRDTIERAARTLEVVGEGVHDAAAHVRVLVPASERVGDFVTTVSRIARQTNLLSLNASIEAARAGEEGAGFAVVADEIRTLAAQSARAAREIAATVQEVREEIAATVRTMDDTARQVHDAGAIAQEARAALDTMLTDIAHIAEHASDAARLARGQASDTTAVDHALQQVDSRASQAVMDAQHAATAIHAHHMALEELARCSDRLAETAERLRTAGSGAPSALTPTAEAEAEVEAQPQPQPAAALRLTPPVTTPAVPPADESRAALRRAG